MERRGFLKGLAAIVGGVALEQAIPFGRVWSFSKEIKCVNAASTYTTYLLGEDAVFTPSMANMATIYYDKMALQRLHDNFRFVTLAEDRPLPKREGKSLTMYRFSAA